MIKTLLVVFACMSVVSMVSAAGLKDAYPGFQMGLAMGVPKSYSPAEIALISAQFNAVTPENCMKPGPVHPTENTWRFEQADALMHFAEQNKLEVFGHTLVWHNQCPDWFFKDGDKPASRELVLSRLKTHITTLVGRYKGRIRSWDVVNEAISEAPGEYLRKTLWLDTIGEDFIEHAFRYAHEADPAAELQYNDFNIELPYKRNKTIRLLKSLKDKGVPIHSVGIQGHYQLDKVPLKQLEEAINEYRALGLKVAITELDLDVIPRRTGGAEIGANEAENLEQQKPKPCPPEVLQRQAEQYAELFRLFEKHKSDLVRVSFWGLNDAHTWLNHWPTKRYNHPLLFDRDSRPKPAYEAVIAAGKK